jgi:hypothetical protein
MKALGGLSLLSLLAVAVIVMFAQTKQTESLFGNRQVLAPKTAVSGSPSGTHKSTSKGRAVHLDPIQNSHDIVDVQQIDVLFQGARLDYLTNGEQASNAQVLASFHRAQGSIKIAKGPREGYFTYRRLSPTQVALCSHSTGNWHCYGTDLRIDTRQNAYGGSLKVTLKKLRVLLRR